MTDNIAPDRTIEKSFIALLVEDVIAAESRRRQDDTQSNRRDVVRATFAAVEGDTWVLREHVRDIAAITHDLSPLVDLALRERVYSVTERGDVIEQPRFVQLPSMIRLIVNQACSIAPHLEIDFSEAGWSHLRTAINIRHRVTHPKTKIDLTITEADLSTISAGFLWTLAMTENVMAATSAAHRLFVDDMRTLLTALKAGDPQALSAYQHALAQIREDD